MFELYRFKLEKPFPISSLFKRWTNALVKKSVLESHIGFVNFTSMIRVY